MPLGVALLHKGAVGVDVVGVGGGVWGGGGT